MQIFNFIFGVPLNLGFGTWSVITVASMLFLIMFGISSAKGDYQDLIKTTLENDAKSKAYRQNRNK
tara:strand:+ start:214 stop:411 length:198 start_codon:yes stop_codon:yes gene_type:complete